MHLVLFCDDINGFSQDASENIPVFIPILLAKYEN